MDTGRASRSISLVLISSVVVFAGWGAGDYLQSTTGPDHAGSYSSGSGSGSHSFWYHSGGYYYSGGARGRPSAGRVGGGSGLGTGGGAPTGGRSNAAAPSLRGGFGSFGHSAGA